MIIFVFISPSSSFFFNLKLQSSTSILFTTNTRIDILTNNFKQAGSGIQSDLHTPLQAEG